jgi:glycerol kinase
MGAPGNSGRFILALDQGTTSSRALVFDALGKVVSLAQREFRQYFPKPGWVEHDAVEIWHTQRDTALEALGKAGLGAHDIAAIGITNQRETTVLWDRATGEPVAPAIVWQDRRTAPACESLRQAGAEPEIAARTGLLVDPYFSGTKLAWLLDEVPERATARSAASWPSAPSTAGCCSS